MHWIMIEKTFYNKIVMQRVLFFLRALYFKMTETTTAKTAIKGLVIGIFWRLPF